MAKCLFFWSSIYDCTSYCECEQALKLLKAQYNQAKGHFSKQIETLTNQTRDLKISEKDKMIKIDELNSKIDGLEKILNTKNDILQQTKDERDQINIQNQKREIQVDSAKIDLMTQAEQNSGVFSDRLISSGYLLACVD